MILVMMDGRKCMFACACMSVCQGTENKCVQWESVDNV